MNKETRVSIKKLNKELFDHIIKVMPSAVALIIRKDSNMESKEPVWFKSFRLNQETFNKNQETFNKSVIKRLDNLDNKVSKLEDYHK